MKSLSNVATTYLTILSILISIGLFTYMVSIIIFEDVDKIEENQTISCQESIITSIIPLFKKCSFAFMIGVLISHPKYLITGVM